MNERIQKLAIDCAIQLDWDFPSDPKEYTFSSAGVEKFAELIVRECVTICNSVQEQYGQYTFTATTVKNRIQEHFGVAE